MSDSSTSVGARLVICPYNLNHRVKPKLFADHLRACRLRYCRQNAQNLKLVRCRINSRHFVPDIEIEFHEKLCEDPIYRQIVAELQTEPIPVKTPSSDSSDNDDHSDDDTTSVSSDNSKYSTSKDDFLRVLLESSDPK